MGTVASRCRLRCAATTKLRRRLRWAQAPVKSKSYTSRGESLRLHAQYLLPKGISALCFVPMGVFGMPCLAIGTEDEQVHIVAIDYEHDGQEVTRLAAGGTRSGCSVVRWPRVDFACSSCCPAAC